MEAANSAEILKNAKSAILLTLTNVYYAALEFFIMENVLNSALLLLSTVQKPKLASLANKTA